jgi:tetratricopeptide (TPR) repeat protein
MDATENHLARARHLFNIHRFDAARQEVEQALAFDPENTEALQYLSLICYNTNDYKAGVQAAEQMLGKRPDDAVAHYCAAINLIELKKLPEAENHVHEALALNADEPDFYAVLSRIYIQKKEFETALNIAENGLELDPEHLECLNYRTICLTKLGRKEETHHAVLETLAAAPDNAYTHTNVGWSKLELGDYQGAKQHFAEALRLDPSYEYARDGMLEALKAKNFFYRYFLFYVFWLSKKTEKNQWVFIVGIYFGTQVIGKYSEDYPFLTPIFYLLVAFALLTWVIKPFFNLILRFDSVARHALNDDERHSSTVVGVGILGAIAALTIAFFRENHYYYWQAVAIFFGIAMIPASLYFMTEKTDLRKKVGIYTLGMLVIGVLSLTILPSLYDIFLYSFLGFQIVYNFWLVRT